MLTALRLGNFKAFGETQEIPIRPITLIFGPNSAGKSSIIHSPALAHEASRRGDLDVFRTELGGSSIDLGGFRQYVFRREAGRRVAIEQPEIHLHPALQAELADVFMQSALGSQRNTFLLETHSEHLILRILRRIRETTEGELAKGMIPISLDHVSVLYVRPQRSGSEILPISVTDDGDFADVWPEGFFEERAKELF